MVHPSDGANAMTSRSASIGRMFTTLTPRRRAKTVILVDGRFAFISVSPMLFCHALRRLARPESVHCSHTDSDEGVRTRPAPVLEQPKRRDGIRCSAFSPLRANRRRAWNAI